MKAIVISGNGTNCEYESSFACRLAGFKSVDIIPIYEILTGSVSLNDYHFLNLAGGFLDGDDLGSAKAAANAYLFAKIGSTSLTVSDQLRQFINDGKLILGACNGFQLLVKLGLLPAIDNQYFTQTVTLTNNDMGRFEDRWVYLAVDPDSNCVFTKGMSKIELPVRHGEGKMVVKNSEILSAILKQHLAPLKYCDPKGNPTMNYPANPNGSVEAIAGLIDPSGRILGLMPHPEAFLHYTNHPRWTRENLPEQGTGLIFYKNAFNYLKDKFG